MKKNLGIMLTNHEMKSIKGGYPPGCVPLGGYCVINRPPTQSGGCCAPYTCIPPGHPGTNNEGKCQMVVVES